VRLPLLFHEWQKQQSHTVAGGGSLNSVLIATPDPRFLISSKGDEAMITGVMETIHAQWPDCKIAMLSDLTVLPESLASMGVSLEPRWSTPWSLAYLTQIISRYDGLIIVGADVMDGHYSPISAARLWVIGDIAARLGKRSIVLGFSFNSQPSGWLKAFLHRLSPALCVFSRDAVSQQRFNTFCKTERADLVADAAFLLKPRPDCAVVERIAGWCQEQRGQGRSLCGFNIHPMLLKNASAEQIAQLVANSAAAIAQVLVKRQVSFVFISHDYRGPGVGDCEILAAIAEKLALLGAGRILSFQEHLHAAELKALTGLMDLVVTGRMHLSIAALGQGTPVAAITYQGKFHGLFQHFGLDEQLLLAPDQLDNPSGFAEWMIAALDRHQPLAEQVRNRLPDVHRLAEKNLAPLAESLPACPAPA
jgi:polysaccharide pyruvyl transferase WcaK-like protein